MTWISWFLNLIVFLAAFLLFQIELITAKIFLPYYGGSYFVWGACVVFFQAALLMGYCAAHLAIKKLGMEKFRAIYAGAFFIPLLFLPGKNLSAIQLHPQWPVVLDVFYHLLIGVGPCFFLLSTVSVMIQSWLAASDLSRREKPYALYAWSNLGSFAGLLTYPLYFEIYFDVTQQLFFWRMGYLCLVAVLAVLFFSVRVRNSREDQEQNYAPISRTRTARWFLLSAAGVMMFLSVTNIVTNEIAPIPLLWIVPLAIYLLAFVLNFRDNPWCPGWIKNKIGGILSIGIALYLSMSLGLLIFFTVWAFFIYWGFLFLICMYCQHALYVSRPEEKGALTYFYVVIALGSFVGGILVSWVIPVVSTTFVEFLAGLLVLNVALLVEKKPSAEKDMNWRLLVVIWILLFQNYRVLEVVATIVVVSIIFAQLTRKPSWVFCCLILMLAFMRQGMFEKSRFIYKARNYYGILKVAQDQRMRLFIHGNTTHGAQYLAKEDQSEPLLYFHPTTPIGEVLQSPQIRSQRTGVIGLGVGTLAAYSRPGDQYDFFELDPDVYQVAQKYFTYLKDAKGKINHYFGDGRLALDQIAEKTYDILIIDAFGSDTIPIHLLTREAIEKYRRYIKDDGIVIFHFTNRCLRLDRVLSSNAVDLGAFGVYKENRSNSEKMVQTSFWFAMTWDVERDRILREDLWWQGIDPMQAKNIRPWTDAYSNIFPSLRMVNPWQTLRRYHSP